MADKHYGEFDMHTSAPPSSFMLFIVAPSFLPIVYETPSLLTEIHKKKDGWLPPFCSYHT